MADMEQNSVKNNEISNSASPLDDSDSEKVLSKDEKMSYYKSELISWIKTLAVSFLVVYIINTFFLQIVFVNGTSMQPTLNGGEKLLTNKVKQNFQRGDIVVIENEYTDNLVKRVIATEGETVKIDFNTGDVYVNGNLLYESYIKTKTTTSYGFSGEEVVPPGNVFVMGDNRNSSNDSRNPDIGFIDVDNIFGVCFFRIYPFDSFGGLN